MKKYENLYCKAFIDYDGNMESLLEELSNLVNSKKRVLRTIETEIAEIDVNKNEDYIETAIFNHEDGYLFSKFYLDIEPVSSIKQEKYINWINKLVISLLEKDINVVIASDFEEKITV